MIAILKKWVIPALMGLSGSLVVSLILSFYLPVIDSFRIVLGFILILIIPGFIWSWIFWSRDQIDFVERLALSLMLSIIGIPLTALCLTKIGLKINTLNTLSITFILILFGTIILTINKLRKKSNEQKI